MNRTRIKSIIEAVLFTMGETVGLERLAAALEMDKEEVKEIISEMMEEFEAEERGVQIIELDGAYQMCTRKEAYEYLIKIISIPKENRLTDVQLETLSIIAYKQPVTRLEIEKIRGVSAEHTVNRLLEVGLIEEKGRLNTPGRPILFGTTEEFLRRFGLKSTEELPDINSERVESFRLEAEEELGFFDNAPEAEEPIEIDT
ncbi:MAG: SMC-Scp complex subunit ScpB [Lachnospiraceae bacterium]|nr:SMC-Scp complex subunit ScpB [Lachnospiraceae bacterium]